MSQITATRRLHFSAGHRIVGHESQCKNIHGHNYVVFLHARGPKLDHLGRVVDFSVLKSAFDPWIRDNWDHGFIYWEKDAGLKDVFSREAVNHLKFYRSDWNPTAENMAAHLLNIAKDLLGPSSLVEVYKVTLWETENCFAEVEL